MINFRKIILFLTCLLFSYNSMSAQCRTTNNAFIPGENLSYKLYFNWKFIWFTVGTANMNIQEQSYNGEDSYCCHLMTKGNHLADRFFVLRDTLTSIVSKELTPLYYNKSALEGERYTVDQAWYHYSDEEVHIKQRFRTHRGEIKENEGIYAECVYDMLSMMLRARSFDASQYKEGDKIDFPMADGGKIEKQTLIYRGKKNFKVEDSKLKYRCLVFSFVEYKEGKEKEIITFYITDDQNHLPVRLDMYLRFGSAKAFLTEAKGVRHPQTSIIEQ